MQPPEDMSERSRKLFYIFMVFVEPLIVLIILAVFLTYSALELPLALGVAVCFAVVSHLSHRYVFRNFQS
jgi:hypothetical protein